MTEISYEKGIVKTTVDVPQLLVEDSKFIEHHWEPDQNIEIKMTEDQEDHFENIKIIILAIEDGKKIKIEEFNRLMKTEKLFELKTKNT